MDKLLTIENVIKYLPLPTFVAKNGEVVLKNEPAKNIEPSGIKEKLLLLQDGGGSVMWDDEENSCSFVAWKMDEYCIITLSSMDQSIYSAVKKISRGIREPLGSLHACSKILMNKLDGDDPSTDEYCAAMSQNLYRMMRLMGNLDIIGWAEGYNFNSRAKNTDIKGIIKSFVDDAKPYVHSLDKEIEYKLPSLPVLSMADSVLLETALGNLIENSLKYSPKGTLITVKLELAFNNMVITVKDNGSGMSPEKLQRVASMKYEWQDIDDVFSAGAGMGLIMARFATSVHGGTMMIHSREGEGTGVTLSLPIKKPDGLNMGTSKIIIKPDILSPLVMFADILPRESYMFLEI